MAKEKIILNLVTSDSKEPGKKQKGIRRVELFVLSLIRESNSVHACIYIYKRM